MKTLLASTCIAIALATLGASEPAKPLSNTAIKVAPKADKPVSPKALSEKER